MKSLLRILLTAAAFVTAAFAQTGTAIPGGNQSSTFVIAKPGRYYLAADRVMTDASKNAIEITSPDVTLDLNGFTLKFANPASGIARGISAILAINVEIRNGSITDIPSHAVYSETSTGTDLRVIDVRISSADGIYSAASNTLVERCQLSDISNHAVWISGFNAVVRNSQIHNVQGGSGIYINPSCQVVGNAISSTNYEGISIYMSDTLLRGGLIANNTIHRANMAASSFSCGIGLASASGILVRDNVVVLANGAGIRSAFGNSLEGNSISLTQIIPGASGHGISSTNSSNIIRNTTGFNNAGNLIGGQFTDAGGNVGD